MRECVQCVGICMCVCSERGGRRIVIFECVDEYVRLVWWVFAWLGWWVVVSDLIWGSGVCF